MSALYDIGSMKFVLNERRYVYDSVDALTFILLAVAILIVMWCFLHFTFNVLNIFRKRQYHACDYVDALKDFDDVSLSEKPIDEMDLPA